ncbi:MAG: nucleotidyltransferase domain-containing protein [Candidatus Heimdallarchaeum endolithica]|uniref:Nucleotidyltransferase domain-containing protein n=1 Tax=Candidatus Heimdallarchaeum endolithica TaxID=2876572 RepID=A0A9Y1FNP8_9ARCH|nr:MAG: nucleotidyltransferase domain-containing protein [Candidatus Heimdallarchaeum endolithica]
MEKNIINKHLQKIVEKAKKDRDVVGVILFGSYLQSYGFNDIDIALVTREGIDERTSIEKRVEYLAELPEKFDIQIYQTLPLAVKKEVLEGKVLYETKELYEIAYKTIKDYERFRKYREDYVRRVLVEK